MAELIERATRLYAKHCEREGVMYQEPCKVSSEIVFDGDLRRVVLRNVNGDLATYLVGKRMRLVA